MPDLDKVIAAFECCDDHGDPDCDHCPYMDDDFVGTCTSRNKLFDDALRLLKAHVMTPEEVEAVRQGAYVWIELRRTDILYSAIRWDNDFIGGNDDYVLLSEVTDCDDYLSWYRFWSAQPSEERRHETPWEDHDG